MSESPLSSLARMGIGVVVWCYGEKCPHYTTYLPIQEAVERFGEGRCMDISRRLKCTACGARGRDGKMDLLPSTLDMNDIHLGRPAGTSERKALLQRAEARQKERELYERMGWTLREGRG